MTLEEVVYQIDGELKTEPYELIGGVRGQKVCLLDKIRDTCYIRYAANRPSIGACAAGLSIYEARQNLVNLLKGNLLVHRWPEMWKSYETTTRIPETLTA